jgi:hypothetical protein
MRKRVIVPIVLLLVGACVIAALAGVLVYLLRVPEVEARPVVLISSPGYGEQVEVGQPVIIQATARDETGVVRVELWVDGQLLESQRSPLEGGLNPFPLLTNWEPLSPGTHTLIVRAFNGENTRAQGSVNVESLALADGDGDGVADEEDLCPEEAGPEAADGCPDRDRDGIRDAVDACPDEVGRPGGNGCPAPSEGDGDGDGLLDGADACPDEPGPPRVAGCPDSDGDGVADAGDACPTEPGLPDHEGCTVPGDMDGDGVADGDDACPEEPGLVELDGCPDFDRDAIPDGRDSCPDQWGLPEHDGCPDRDLDGVPDDDDVRPDDPGVGGDFGGAGADAPDSDGDGIPDTDDECPEEEGLLEHDGCPRADSADADGDGTDDTDQPPGGGFGDWNLQPFLPGNEPIEAGPQVEFQALEFEVFEDYDRVYCYASLADGPEERYPQSEDQFFSPGDERHWNIDEHLGRRFAYLAEDEPMRVFAHCYALTGIPGQGLLVDLGSFEQYHDPPWQGEMVEVFSNPGPEGDYFRVEYRLCEGSCEEALFSPPRLRSITVGPHSPFGPSERTAMLRWDWDGDEAQISGFRVYVNGTFVRAVGTDRGLLALFGGYYEHEISDLRPTCGETLEFEVTVYSGPTDVPDAESPRSNSRVWEADACQRTVRVTFQSLETAGLGSRKGPIKGTFTANDQTLFPAWRGQAPTFVATDDPETYLEPGHTYDLARLFRDIETEAASHVGYSGDNLAPDVNFLEVQLGPHDTLTFSGSIWDDSENRVFFGSESIRPGEIIPGPYRVEDQGIELVVLVDVLVGPEAGDRPDLVISDITLQSSSNHLQIDVFNRAAYLENETLTIRAERLDGELLDTMTWDHVSIAPGAHQILGTPVVLDAFPIYDLRLILDPDNTVEETEEGELNNVYETPVLVRVELTELAAYPCESFLATTSDHWFLFWVGHGPSRREIQWVVDRRRYPSLGTLELDTYLDVTGDDPDWFAHWHPSDDQPDRFIIEFEMPADENLYVEAAGYEDDVGADDMLGSVFGEYGPDVNYGHRDDTYRYESPNQGCDEGEPLGFNYFGFHAWWRITRVH